MTNNHTKALFGLFCLFSRFCPVNFLFCPVNFFVFSNPFEFFSPFGNRIKDFCQIFFCNKKFFFDIKVLRSCTLYKFLGSLFLAWELKFRIKLSLENKNNKLVERCVGYQYPTPKSCIISWGIDTLDITSRLEF